MSRPVSSWVAETLAILLKEWRGELRTRYALNTVALFAVTTLVVVSINLGPLGVSRAALPVLPVVLWLILLFAASAGLPRSFVHEEEIHTAAALRLAATPSALYCGKMLYNLSLIYLLELLVAPLYLMLLELAVAEPVTFVAALAAGGFGLAAGSTLIAAMVAQARIKATLFAVLAFPVLLPLLVFAVQLTLGAVAGDPKNGLVELLILYDGTLLVAGLMLFPVIWNP